MLECVVNISEGANPDVIAALAAAAGTDLLDVHSDPHHHRSVFTLVGEQAPRALAEEAVRRLDLRTHAGVHPRIGVVDVVPFVPLHDANLGDAIAARDRFGAWASEALALPCFAYGPERTLPEVRKGAFTTLWPDWGAPQPHITAGAAAIGAREVLVAYNVWLAEPDVALARAIAARVRGPRVRALGLAVGGRAQVSMNLVEPYALGPGDAYDRVSRLAADAGAAVAGGELVGLLPSGALSAVDPRRWHELDLAEGRTIEARLAGRRRE